MISNEWVRYKLGKLVKIKTGGTPRRTEPHYWSGDIPWMSSGEIHKRYINDTKEFITEDGLQSSNACLLPQGTVMIALNGQGRTRGTVAILRTQVTCNQSLAGFITHNNILNADYLFFYLDSKYQSLRDLSGDHGRNGLNLKLLGEIEIDLPPLPEQKKIAAILSSVDDAIQATQAVIDQTHRVKQGLLQQLLTRGIGHSRFKQTEIGEIPEGWEVRSLDEVSKVIDSLHKTPVFSDAGIPMVRVTEIKGGLLNLEGAKKVSEAVYAEFSKSYTPKRGDIVLSRVGTYGASSFVDTDEIFCMGQNTVVISPLIEGIFLFQQLQSPWIRDQIENGVVGSSQKTVSLRTLKGLKILVPTFVERMKISEVLTNVDEKIRYEENILKRYSHLKRGLMQDLLTGRVRVKLEEEGAT